MMKIYVIDTSILIQAPYAAECFEDNLVVLPMIVLEELGRLAKKESESGGNARKALKKLELYRMKGNLFETVVLENGSIIKVEKNFSETVLPLEVAVQEKEARILKVCIGLAQQRKEQVVLITKDILLRLKAKMMGISAEDFATEQVKAQESQYTGRAEVYVPDSDMKEFKKKGIPLEKAYVAGKDGEARKIDLVENQFLIIKSDQSEKKAQLARVEKGMIRKLDYRKSQPYGIRPRNAGQYFLQEALMQPAKTAPLVIVKGMAGTSKTFYTLAVGLEKLLNHPTGEYRRILISRPNAQFDEAIGFLPGDEKEKISPLMRPVIDNLEQLVDSNEEERYEDERELQGKVQEIFDRGLIQAEALNFIRGRSIERTYLIIDEAQNTTPDQIKGIITRAGKDTKIILLGDPKQIDRPYLDERTNGLSYASEYMKGSSLCWQITMHAEECERSQLAMEAVQRLERIHRE